MNDVKDRMTACALFLFFGALIGYGVRAMDESEPVDNVDRFRYTRSPDEIRESMTGRRALYEKAETEGVAARDTGEPITDGPYAGTMVDWWWRKGWNAADSEPELFYDYTTEGETDGVGESVDGAFRGTADNRERPADGPPVHRD